MGIKPLFKQADINKIGLKMLARIEETIISRFQIIGEEFINNARSKSKDDKGFGDITGNLRSSIGYVILKNGKTVTGSAFDIVKKGSEGSANGKKLIRELRARFNTGYVLIVVAGMKYAAAVESRGKDVITGSSLIAESELKEAIKGLANKVSR